MRRPFPFLLAFSCAAGIVSAQVRLSSLDGLAAKAKESTDITLDSSMLRLASQFFSSGKGGDEAKLKALLDGIKGISVRTFEFAEEGKYRSEDLDQVRAQLRTGGWGKIIGTHSDEGESNEIYTRTDQGHILGVVIIAAERKELSVVAIDGTIDLADLANLGGHFGIPPLTVPPDTKKKGNK